MGLFTKKVSSSETVVGLTEIGKQKAEGFHLTGAKGEVIGVLQERGASSVSEVAENSRLDPMITRQVINSLIRHGYVRVAGGNDGYD